VDKRDFYYSLPEELIAQKPLEKREESRLLVVPKNGGEFIHSSFKEIQNYLNPGDCLVFNNSRVIFARLYGKKENTGTKVEFLLIRNLGNDQWETLVKPGKKVKIGDSFNFEKSDLKCNIVGITDSGGRIVEFEYPGSFSETIKEIGEIPLPPYIKEKLENPERYQTVYSKVEGSVAAPTAGLHFTDGLLEEIRQKGVKTAFITLHVGIGTFRPVKTDKIEDHQMHEEYYEISKESSEIINGAINDGKRIIAVGTTSVRTLEGVATKEGKISPTNGWTNIFIYPGYNFKVVDGIITNFHLPESTLIMLVSAFIGRERTLKAYNIAVENNYRFFSFGDAMLII
jgi:S-adenosylmethionine:tRNA ribosyltransferase-isomerase